MPVLTRECLALKLRQNWLAKHPVDAPAPSVPLDDSLTSLNWLQNLNIMKITAPTPPASPTPQDDYGLASLSQYTPQTQVNPNAVLNMGNVKVKQEPGSPISSPSALYKLTGQLMDVAPPTTTNPNAFHDKIDYKTNPYVKPPYSYATLICMAMKETKKNKITLAGIYNWITENFMYYRHADPSWQNSIRHNLSLNKCFQKVPRRKDEPGKGGFWRINPEYEDMFINGIFKKRRASATPTNLQPVTKRLKVESCEDSNSSLSDTETDSSPMLNTAALELSIKAPTTPGGFEIKQEPADHVFPTPPADHLLDNHVDFNWNSLLTQDIEVGGIRIKTEDLIESSQESAESDIASPITTLSPPPSDNNSEMAIEDFINNTDFSTEFEDPLDFTTGQPLDLSISGMSLRPPEWWSDSINDSKGFFSPNHSQSQDNNGNKAPHELSTPILPQSVTRVDQPCDHPWAEDKNHLDEAIASFDTDIAQLFDLDNIPSPSLTQDS